MSESRTSKSIKNAQVSLFFYFLQLILGFWSRKAFFDYLGSEILGLNTTAANLLGFLNLAELGIGMSVGYFLYQPLFDKDYKRLNEIVSLQGWLYKRVAYLIILGSCILFFFFPMIFAKSDLSLWYAYSTYAVLLFSSLLGYFYNYRQNLLWADQKGYKLQKITQGFNIGKTIIQIIGITYLPYPFVFWLSIEFLNAVITTISINVLLRREYPWLKTDTKKGTEYMRKYPTVLTKTKQAFFHRIGGVALTQSSPLIMYAYTTLTVVALYGNYILIVGKLANLLGVIFSSTGAAIGNLVASKDKERIMSVFWELTDSRLAISTIFLLCIYFLTDPFLYLWLGEGYSLGNRFLILYIAVSSIAMTRCTVDNYINAYGLFKDVWAPIAEAILNIGLSILFGFYIGLEGVILGVLVSQVLIILIWKPFFLFREGLQIPPSVYFRKITYRYFLVILIFIISSFILKPFELDKINTVHNWLIWAIILFVIFTIVMIATFSIFKGMRSFIWRIKNLRKL